MWRSFKLCLLATALAVLSPSAWAALPVSLLWEIQTGGSDSNGGGFAAGGSGTDKTQPTSSPVSRTDIVIDGSDNTKITSAGTAFDSTDPGNVLNITSGTGFTVGRYHAVSEAAGVLTVDRAIGTTGSTGGNGILGGALASPGETAGAMIGGNDVHQKSGTYTVTTTSNNVANGVVTIPAGPSDTDYSRWFGYQTSRGDDGTKPKIIADGVITNVTLFTASNNFVSVNNIQVDGNSRSGVEGLLGTNGNNIFTRVHLSNFVDFAIRGAGATWFDVQLDSCTGSFAAIFDSGKVDGLYADASKAVRITTGSLVNFIIDNGTVDAVLVDDSGYIANGSIYSPVGDGVDFGAARKAFAINILVEDAGGYSFRATSKKSVILRNCGSRNPSVDHALNIFDEGSLLEATADFFTDPDNDNFILNTTAGGGAAARSAGFPGVYPGASTTGFADMGAARHQDPAGGGGNTIITQGVSF